LSPLEWGLVIGFEELSMQIQSERKATRFEIEMKFGAE